MGMGTTATLAMIYQNKIITAHVGDSRAYMIGDEIKQITKDHSYVQELVSRGEISPEMAKITLKELHNACYGCRGHRKSRYFD